MGDGSGFSAFWRMRADRQAARAACRLALKSPPLPGFALLPEPLPLGQYAKGRQIVAGRFLLAGQVLESASPWTDVLPSNRLRDELHGFGWLDHLAAAGDHSARETARRLTGDWWARFGDGQGPGWRADLAGRRLTRWLLQAEFLLAGGDAGSLLGAMAAHMHHLQRRAGSAAYGLPRIEALAGRALGALLLEPAEGFAHGDALEALTAHAALLIAEDGGIASRNPDELLQIAMLLGWVLTTLDRSEHPLPGGEALRVIFLRAAAALRVLRHADGSLARFQGGGGGYGGQLERVLALVPRSAPRATASTRAAMGYARLEGGRSTVIIDAAPPPEGVSAREPHASTLAFELTSGRRAVIVSCGSGADFGAEWRAAGRATLSHSTLGLDGWSSARRAASGPLWQRLARRLKGDLAEAALADGPRRVGLERHDERYASAVELTHDGWLRTHGLTHTRRLDLSRDGRALMGEDSLTALAPAERRRLEEVLAAGQGKGGQNRRPGFTLRFHLHPDSEASLDMNGSAVSIALPSGEVWIFRPEREEAAGASQATSGLGLEPSVWLEPGRRAPRPAQQIVLRAEITGPAQRLNWTLTKAQDTPHPIRDPFDAGGDPLDADLLDADHFDRT